MPQPPPQRGTRKEFPGPGRRSETTSAFSQSFCCLGRGNAAGRPLHSLEPILRDGASRLLRVRLKMILGISSSCEAAGEELDAGDYEPRLGAGDGGFEVLDQATVAPEPGEGALNHPSPRLGFESSDTMSSCDDLDGPFAEIGDRIEQFIASVDAVGEDVPQLGEAAAQRFEQWHGAMVVLHIA